MRFELGWNQKITVTATPKTRKGVPVAVETPVWNVNNLFLTATPSEDGLSCTFVSVPKPEDLDTATVEVVFDADRRLGEERVPISKAFEIEIIPDEAADIDFGASEPEDIA